MNCVTMPVILAEILRSPSKHDAALDWLAPVANWGCLIFAVICLIPCVMTAWKRERVFSGTLVGWAGLVVWSLVMCLLAPFLALKMTGEPQVFGYFPKMPDVVFAVATGWTNSGALSLFIWMIRELWRLWLKFRLGSPNAAR